MLMMLARPALESMLGSAALSSPKPADARDAGPPCARHRGLMQLMLKMLGYAAPGIKAWTS